ncbi:hypothetical protein EBU99_01565 [bacterium]|nr:hypothetical protein [bacterium]
MLSFLFVSCREFSPGTPGLDAQPCGRAQSPDLNELNGLLWTAGTPTTANVVCGVRNGQWMVVQTLDPDSRDPILWHDESSNLNLLVERFSGRQARATRVTGWNSEFQMIGQRGDWPKNIYSALRMTHESLAITGFDEGVVEGVSLGRENFASRTGPIAQSINNTLQDARAHPVLALRSGTWIAALESGYDLVNFKPTQVKAYVSSTVDEGKQTVQEIRDTSSQTTCVNAYQSILLSASNAIVSCNPQYYGPQKGQRLSVFAVELTPQGEIVSRELLSRDGGEVQRIDLWGYSKAQLRVAIALRRTTATDYQGEVFQSGWLNLARNVFEIDSRVRGPVYSLPGKDKITLSCQAKSEFCKEGQFSILKESELLSTTGFIKQIDAGEQLPFQAFPQDIPAL